VFGFVQPMPAKCHEIVEFRGAGVDNFSFLVRLDDIGTNVRAATDREAWLPSTSDVSLIAATTFFFIASRPPSG
jgi:hypothetical protein